MTLQERHEAYKKLLKVVCNDPSTNNGFCHYITITFGINAYDQWNFKHYFPELWEKKPENTWNSFFWFQCTQKGWKERIKILAKCIEETKPVKQ